MVINNNTVKTMTFMGSGVTSLSYNGVVVWEMEEPSVPTVILTLTGGTQEYHTYADGIIPNSAFYNRTDIIGVEIGNGITSISSNAFFWCFSLTSVTIPNNVTSIGYAAFGGCSSLASVTILDSVTSIGESAFQECTSMTSVTIGNSVTSIDYWAFADCSSLTSITCQATTPPTLTSNNVFRGTNDCPIYVPSASVSAYQTATNWSSFATRIQAIPNS